MKTIQKSFLLLMISFALNSFSQTIGDYVDVIYLNNGSMVTGVIIEQIPGKSIKIKATDGIEYIYDIIEIKKFSREKAIKNIDENVSKASEEEDDKKIGWINNYKKKDKGYFIEIDLLFNSISNGFRVTNGYKFGEFAYLGLGFGVNGFEGYAPDFTIYPNSSSYRIPNEVGTAINLSVIYSGDILRKRITPFYQVEAGYEIPLNNSNDNRMYNFYNIENYGGPMAGGTFGVKFKTKRKIVYKLSLDTKLAINFAKYNNQNTSNFKSGLGVRFGIGF